MKGEKGGGQAIAKIWGGGQCGSCSFLFFFYQEMEWGGRVSDRPAGGAVFKRERAERLA